MRKLFLSVILILLPGVNIHAVSISEFIDIDPKDPVWNSFVDYTERGVFSGMLNKKTGQRLVAPDDVILKSHAALFLSKVLGNPNPTMELVLEAGILSKLPDPKELVTHATWIKMLSNAFNVPVTSLSGKQSWYVAPYALAKTIGAVEGEDPFDFASRRFVLMTTHLYEEFFAVNSLHGLLSQREQTLMEVRDLIVETKMDLEGVENRIWQNIITGQDLPLVGRAGAIQNFNFASLLLLSMRLDPHMNQRDHRKIQVFYFLDRAEQELPDSKAFADDLRAIADNF